MFLVASSPSGCWTENPLQTQPCILQMNDSSQMWSMKWSLRVFVYIKLPSCLMIQNRNKLATSSDKLSSLHTLHWCEESCPVRLHRQHMKQEEASWQYEPKNVTHRVNHRVECPEFPPSPRWCNQHHTINTEASWVTAETKRQKFFALGAATTLPKKFRNQNAFRLTYLPWRSCQPQRLIFKVK